MSDFILYQLAIAKKDAAYNDYNHASVVLTLRQIEERLAEINSQAEPFHSAIEKLDVDASLRQLIKYEIKHFCRYVVTGRKDRLDI